MFLNFHTPPFECLHVLEPARVVAHVETIVMLETNCRPGCHAIYVDIPKERLDM